MQSSYYFSVTLFTEEVRADLDLLLGMDKAAQQRHAALFLLKLKEYRQLSQVAIDDIVQEWEGLFSHTVQQLNARVRERLANAGVDVDSVEGLQEVFHDLPSPFEGLNTQHLQEKYYRDSLGLVVSLQCYDTIVMSTEHNTFYHLFASFAYTYRTQWK